MSDRIPYTHFTNFLTLIAYMSGIQEYVLPANFAKLISGTIIAQGFPKGIAEKYKYSVSSVRLLDFVIHWLPVLLLMNKYKKNTLKTKHYLFSALLPIIYFTYNTKSKTFENPIETLKNTYPGVPLYVYAFYYAGLYGLNKTLS